MDTTRELTFGEKAVGITFNPSNNPTVDKFKKGCADLIDELNEARKATNKPDIIRMFSLAITDVQSAQMWGVKALTWQYE